MKRYQYRLTWISLLAMMAICTATAVYAQESETVGLTISLRNSDGTPVSGERIALQRLPQDGLPPCTTDSAGICRWQVRRGLYELTFSRPVDPITRVAVAEGGLTGLGITVGDAPITYHVTFQPDGRVYFDTAPEADVPVPFIPTEEMLHDHHLPPVAVDDSAAQPTPTATTMDPARDIPPVPPTSPWRVLAYITGGLLLGYGLYGWSQWRKQRQQGGGNGTNSIAHSTANTLPEEHHD